MACYAGRVRGNDRNGRRRIVVEIECESEGGSKVQTEVSSRHRSLSQGC